LKILKRIEAERYLYNLGAPRRCLEKWDIIIKVRKKEKRREL